VVDVSGREGEEERTGGVWVDHDPELSPLLRGGRRDARPRRPAKPTPGGLKAYLVLSLLMAGSLLLAGRLLEAGVVAALASAAYFLGRWSRWVS